MKTRFSGVLICCISFFFIRCNLNFDFKETEQVSQDVQEAKRRNTLIAEYKVENLEGPGNLAIPIEQVWAERDWYLTLDSNGNQTIRVENLKYNIVFKIRSNDEYNEENYLKKWVLWSSDSCSSAIINHQICLQPDVNATSDSIKVVANLLSKPFNYKENLRPIASFIAIRK